MITNTVSPFFEKMGLTASCLPKQPAPAVDFDSDVEQKRRREISEMIVRGLRMNVDEIRIHTKVTYNDLSPGDQLVVQTAHIMAIRKKHKLHNEEGSEAVIRELTQRQAKLHK
jgi:hypothetical protein